MIETKYGDSIVLYTHYKTMVNHAISGSPTLLSMYGHYKDNVSRRIEKASYVEKQSEVDEFIEFCESRGLEPVI